MIKHVLSTLALGLTLAAQAQTFPSKPVRIITPFPVGSGPEGVARLVMTGETLAARNLAWMPTLSYDTQAVMATDKVRLATSWPMT